ncbi:MAG: RagB/SusD family nutrient uptake outer membrane protein [Prevotella sp.]|jgi:hypothetical protein|nr:RagB/SusD family nutrient uptake outer membrane protein [Prevotella sp.]
MKLKFKHIIYSIAIISYSVFSSCDDLLETKNFSDMSPENFFLSEGDIDAAVTGIYLPITTNWGYGDGGTGGWYSALLCADLKSYYPKSMITTDEALAYDLSNIFNEFNWGPADGDLPHTYHVIRFVARATDIINQIEQSNAATEEIRERYIAETKTLRAYYMYVLLDCFGPTNVKLDPTTLMSNEITARPTMETYVGYMEKDLADAIATTSFPDKYNDDADNWGRMSRAIAYGIRIKLYMHQKQWDKAKSDAQEIINMGYSLLENYEDVFNVSRTSEHILSIPANSAYDNFYVTEVLPSDFKKGYNEFGDSYIRGMNDQWLSGWQAYCMRWDFYDTFSASDVRKKTILIEYDTNDGGHKGRDQMRGAIPLKYTDTQKYDYGIQKEHPALRYAEVLLSYAEAENELNGPSTAAVNAVKQITDRAQTTIPASAVTSKEAFRDFILAERGRELYCEGQRRQDLIRHGVFIRRANERGANAQEHHVLFPIPQAIITEANGIVVQNPGYTN